MIFNITITNSERMALCDLISDYISKSDHTERFIDIAEDTETTPTDLLCKFLNATPTR